MRYITRTKEIVLGVVLVGLVVMGIELDKHLFSEPTRRPDITFAKKLSNALRVKAQVDGAQIVVHSGLNQPWRYFLLQP